MARSPETDLVKLYAERATAVGRSLGLGPLDVIELEAKKPGKAAEAEILRSHLSQAHIIACDERGAARTSRGFSGEIGALRDRGVRRLAFLIGGADGLDAALVNEADQVLAFGPQTWPHALVRVMLAEQVYRAITILGGGPYHRD